MASPLKYRIVAKNPGAHLFEVTLIIDSPDPAGQAISLPAWIPGSYLIRDFARHVVSIRASADGEDVALTKTDKSTWLADACASPLTVTADIYAYDQSVRGAHFDTTHAYFNGTCVFFRVHGQEQRPCEVDIVEPASAFGHDWRVATSMLRKDAPQYGFGTYVAGNYDELIDQPVEIGPLAIGEFEAGGVPHAIAVRGQATFDMGRLCKDLSKLCDAHIQLLGKPANLDRYVFLLAVLHNGYGGLEHCWSSSIVCSRKDLPKRDEEQISETYRKFLGLCSHEYFHLWNVKRMRPAAFTPYDLRSEKHTGLLWVFEGITSYYDDLTLVRAGIITPDSYLELLGQTVTKVLRGAGRHLQSVEESSFDAWIKFYKQEANANNAIVSYYTKGSLIALALDLYLRSHSNDQCSLDDVMRECWRRYGESGEGMPERGLESIAAEVSGLELGDFFERYVRGTSDLPLGPLLAEVGVSYKLRPAQGSLDAGGKRLDARKSDRVWLGAALSNRNSVDTFATVQADSPAENAGLAAGDVAVALDMLRLTNANIDQRLRDYRPGDTAVLTVFRNEELMRLHLHFDPPPENRCYLELQDDCATERESRRRNWLGI